MEGKMGKDRKFRKEAKKPKKAKEKKPFGGKILTPTTPTVS
tara:strand:- start:2658 stop:2780 length:123 start_codon:yes stop_codon:yes gene_type:complete